MTIESVLAAIEQHALTPEAIQRVVDMAERDDFKEKQTIPLHEQEANSKKLKNLINAIAGGSPPASLVEEIQRLEIRQKEIASELKELKPIQDLPREEIASQLELWRRQLRGSITQGRMVLQKILKGRILMIPRKDGEGYEFRAPTRFDKLFQGMAIPMPKFISQSNEGYAYSSHRERRIQSKLNSESGEAERSSKR